MGHEQRCYFVKPNSERYLNARGVPLPQARLWLGFAWLGPFIKPVGLRNEMTKTELTKEDLP